MTPAQTLREAAAHLGGEVGMKAARPSAQQLGRLMADVLNAIATRVEAITETLPSNSVALDGVLTTDIPGYREAMALAGHVLGRADGC